MVRRTKHLAEYYQNGGNILLENAENKLNLFNFSVYHSLEHITNNRDRRHRLSLFLFICCLSTSNLSTCRLVNSSTNILLLWNNLEHFCLTNQLHTRYFLCYINSEERLIRSELSLQLVALIILANANRSTLWQ